jgi:hypothetical protein
MPSTQPSVSDQQEDASASENVDVDRVKPLLIKMNQLLTINDMDALSLLYDLEKVLAGTSHTAAFAHLEEKVNQLQFQAAVEELDRMMEEMGVEMSE